MSDQSFEDLAKEAAAGLKSDPELFLDVKQELHSHLEDKAQYFASQGKSEEESAALSRQSFGSPMDVAAELLAANRQRMKLRSLLRLAVGLLVVPLAILLALYVGYGRFARQQILLHASTTFSSHLPMLPFFEIDLNKLEKQTTLFQELMPGNNGANILNYWKTHRNEPDNYIYYATYALSADSNINEQEYVANMHKGEEIEPNNALYNLLLAHYYLSRGMNSTEKSNYGNKKPDTYIITNRTDFITGINELNKAAVKPYLKTYQMNILRKKLSSLQTPVFTEDYISRMAVSASVLFPYLNKWRDLAHDVPGGAHILLTEGKLNESEKLINLWKPLSLLYAHDTEGILFQDLAGWACASEMSSKSADVYAELGLSTKAYEMRIISKRIKQVMSDWKNNAHDNSTINNQFLNKHAGHFAQVLLPVFGGKGPTADELIATRMLEHTIFEEAFIQILLGLLLLALGGSLIQSGIWLYRLRGAASVPILLLPPAREILKAVLLGIALPMIVYWLYSRLPIIGGREYGWSYMWPRFAAEFTILFGILFWVPAHLLRKYIRSRYDELGIPSPAQNDEKKVNIRIWPLTFGALILTALTIFVQTEDISPYIKTVEIFISLAMIVIAIRYAGKMRNAFGLYYGSLARSIIPVYAFSIIFLSLTAQPWLLYQEAQWLKKDTTIFGSLNDKRSDIVFTSIEARASKRFSKMLIDAINGK